MKNKRSNTGLWILAGFLFLMAISAIANGGVLAFLLFGITGIFVSPLRKKIFEGRKLANLKKSHTILIASVEINQSLR